MAMTNNAPHIRGKYTDSELCEYARTNDIAIEDIFFRWTIENILYAFSSSDSPDEIIVGSSIFSAVLHEESGYKRSVTLYYCPHETGANYLGDPHNLDKFITNMLSPNANISSYKIQQFDNLTTFDINYVFNHRLIPLSFNFYNLYVSYDQIRSVDIDLPLKAKSIRLYELIPETILVRSFISFFTYLELISDMRILYDLYTIISCESLSGRKVVSSLSQSIKESNLEVDRDICNLFRSYTNNPYLKKKWRAYIKRNHFSFTPWEDVISLITDFLEKIIDYVISDSIFLEDWMPQLKRFM